MVENKCPKCGEKLGIFDLKQECPKCKTNILYYNLDERLKQDAESAQKEVEAFDRFAQLIKNSAIASPVHIIRLVLFFTPLGSMCLPMFNVNGEKINLIAFIMGVITGSVDLGAITQNLPYLLSVISMVLVILLSLAEIISSLFSAGKNGLKRNMIFSAINLAAFIGLGMAVTALGGALGIGWFVTLAIYLVCDILHFVVDNLIKNKKAEE